MRIMKKLTLIASCVALLLSSCAHEYNQVLKSGDYTYKYEYAKQSYAQGKYLSCHSSSAGTGNDEERFYRG